MMEFQRRRFLLSLLFSISLFHLSPTATAAALPLPGSGTIAKYKVFIRQSCHSTPYPDNCYDSLSRFVVQIKQSPLNLATAGIDFADSVFEAVFEYILNHYLPNMERCVETVDSSHSAFRKSVNLLNHVKSPMDIIAVELWINNVLREEKSCLDDLMGLKDSPEKKDMIGLVTETQKYTKIALALVQLYARSKRI